jgi:hypothetical protein
MSILTVDLVTHVVLLMVNSTDMVFGSNTLCVVLFIRFTLRIHNHDPFQREEAHKIWGFPSSLSDVHSLFAQFCRGKLPALPWSDTPPSAETTVIASQLAKLNEVGFLTINSQPAVNGARSDDRVHGWGPSNGFVYQKVAVTIRTCSFV